MKLVRLILESDASEEAHKKHYTYAGYGKWTDSSGQTVAKTVQGKLVALHADADEDSHGIVNHLLGRGLDPEKYNVMLDKKEGIAYFFLFNLSGQLVGYQRYNPKGDKKDHGNTLKAKYYNYITKEGPATSKLAVWGLETIKKGSKILFITEGIFDAVKIHNAGYPAIAVLGNNPLPLKPWLATLPHLHKIAIIDTDENKAGDKLKNLADMSTSAGGAYHDLGEMPQAEVDKFVKDTVAKVK